VEIAWGEPFVLREGDRVGGTWANRERRDGAFHAVRFGSGGDVRVARDQGQVQLARQQSPAPAEYEKIRSGYADTVDGHWQLAQWCAEHRLNAQREIHLQRILQLDSDHEPTRKILGYRLVRGQWMTRDEEMAARGMTLYRGHYRTSQYIELGQRQEERRQAEAEWSKKIRRWRGWLDSDKGRKASEAEANFRAIRDPLAVPTLQRLLSAESNRQVKILYVDVLAEIARRTAQRQEESGRAASILAIQVLVERSLQDPDREVRLACVEHMAGRDYREAVTLYVKALSSADNQQVRRAATGLKEVGDLTAVPALIDALVTTHTAKAAGPSGQTSASFSRNGGGGGLSNGAPRKIRRAVANPQVLSALATISGQNFNYDENAWRSWHARQQRSPSFNARRD